MININIQVIFMDHSQIQRCHLIRRCPFEKPDLRIFISTVDMTCLITPCSLTPVDLTYTCSLRSAQRLEEPMSREDEDFSEHDYYNSIPGKEPPVGGVVDSRLRPSSSMLGHIHSQPQSKAAAQVWGQSAAATAFTVVFMLGFKVGKVKNDSNRKLCFKYISFCFLNLSYRGRFNHMFNPLTQCRSMLYYINSILLIIYFKLLIN